MTKWTNSNADTDADADTDTDVDASCPFCAIIQAFPPIEPLQQDYKNTSPSWNPDRLVPPAFVLLSTAHVVAFMDIAPLTRGHVLVSPRRHRTKIGDLTPEEMSEIGRLLPLLARSVIKAVLPDIPHSEADYNVVQNNGPGAAQVIPHVHFHIIPRPPLNYQPPAPTISKNESLPSIPQLSTNSSSEAAVVPSNSNKAPEPVAHSTSQSTLQPARKHPPAKIPTGLQRSYIQFGRGVRHELDEDDAAVLVEQMRRCVQEEWRRDIGPGVVSKTAQTLAQGIKLKLSSTRKKPQKL